MQREAVAALRMLGRILVEGPEEMVRTNPVLGPFFPDDPAVEHYRIFGRAILPYGSVFLSAQRLLGRYAERAPFLLAGADPDHLGQQLGWLAYRLEQGQSGEGGELRSWMAPVVRAVELEESPFFREVLDLSWALVRELVPVSAPLPPAGPFPLEDPRTGIRELATWLCTPIHSGVWLSHSRMVALARPLPVGFGSRDDVLETVLQTAIFQDRWRECCGALREEWRRWGAWYRAHEEHAWAERAAGGEAVLARMQAAGEAAF